MTRIEATADPERTGPRPGPAAAHRRRFARYVDEGRLPGWQIVVSRHGQVGHASSYGQRDVARRSADRGGHALPDLLDDQTDHRGGGDDAVRTGRALADRSDRAVAAGVRRIHGSTSAARMWLRAPGRPPSRSGSGTCSPTPGLAYGFLRGHPVSMMYLNAGLDELGGTDATLAAMTERWAAMPLMFEPGSEWQYSVVDGCAGAAGRGGQRPTVRRLCPTAHSAARWA